MQVSLYLGGFLYNLNDYRKTNRERFGETILESGMTGNRRMALLGRAATMCLVGAAMLAPGVCHGAAPRGRVCSKVMLTGEVNGGQEWKAGFGQGWVFRLLPIRGANLSGWDLVVDEADGAGYPDALLLASPPYNSINEREVGTSYGLRAQDAIGWNPRSFHFLTDTSALRDGQKLFKQLNAQSRVAQGGAGQGGPDPKKIAAVAQLSGQLIALQGRASAGEFRILDAKLSPGDSDAASYAENWALQSVKTPHTFQQPAGTKPTELGQFYWMKFQITLWLPSGWQTPKGMTPTKGSCAE